MDISLAQFTKVAQSNWFNNDIVLSKDGSHITSKFFHTKSSNPAAQVTNKATMEAFRTALQAEFGTRGVAAFNALLATRGGHSLRKNDVLNTVKMIQTQQTEHFAGVKSMNEFHGALRKEFGRYGEEAFQAMKRTYDDPELTPALIKETVKLAQDKKTAVGAELRSAANASLDKIFSDPQRPYHKLPAGFKQELRGKVMEKFETLLLDDDMRKYYCDHIRDYELVERKNPQFPEGMDGFMSRDVQDAAKTLGRPDLVKADPIFNASKKYDPNFNPMHAPAEAIDEGWVNVSLSEKPVAKDLNLIRGGFRGLAELAWTAVRNAPNYPYTYQPENTQKLNQNRAMTAFEERMKDDGFVAKLADSYEKNPKVLEDVMLRLAVYGDKAPLDEVLENVVAQPEAKADQPEEKVEAQPEAKVAQPEVKVAQPEVNKAKPEAKVAKPEVKVAQPEVKQAKSEAKVAQPEAKVEAKVEQVKVEASKSEGKKDIKRLRRDLRGLAEQAWANVRTSPHYPYAKFPEKVQKMNQDRALKAFDKRIKEDDLVLKLAKSYENDPKSLEAVMLRLAVYAEKAPLDEVLKVD